MRTRRFIGLLLILGLLSGIGALARAAETTGLPEGEIGHTPPRLSLTTGDVSFWRPGAQDWSQAQVNTPLAPGDLLYTGPESNLEIQIGAGAFVRGGPGTQLGLENQEPDFIRFRVAAGSASFDLHGPDSGLSVELDTPHGVFTMKDDGYYRVEVEEDRTSFITRRGGRAVMTHPGGEGIAIGPDRMVTIEGVESPRTAFYAAPRPDEWDRWNEARTEHLSEAVSARYVPHGVYGVDELDRYGTWRILPTYGAVWIPRGVPAGWAPYSTGSWVVDPYYGWTWVDTAPWGWAPYHYGRWVFVSGGWAWAPGPGVVRPVYAPALVAFFGGPSAGISIGFGDGPVVGWVSLGWGEPCVPWWGRFRHRPWWGGWGGPRVVNNVVVHKTTVVNVREMNVYRNARERNAVVMVKERHFGRGPVASTRLHHADGKRLKPIHGAPGATATPARFAPGDKREVRPPGKVPGRSVVATRPPRVRPDPGEAKERKRESARGADPAPRLVPAPRQDHAAPVGQELFQERSQPDRTGRGLPPAHSTAEARPVRKKAPEGAGVETPRIRAFQGEAGRGHKAASREHQGPRVREREAGGPSRLRAEKAVPRSPARVEAKGSRQRESRAVRPEPPARPQNGRRIEAPPNRTEKFRQPGQAPSRGMNREAPQGRGAARL